MRIFSLTATEKRLLNKLSWRAAPKPYTLPGVSCPAEKKPDPGFAQVSGYGYSVLWPPTSRATAQKAHGGRQSGAQRVLVARFEIGHTQRKYPACRPQPPASSHIVQSRAPGKGHRYPCLFQACWSILHQAHANCKCFSKKVQIIFKPFKPRANRLCPLFQRAAFSAWRRFLSAGSMVRARLFFGCRLLF